MLTSLCIIFSTEAFYPKDGQGKGTSEIPLSVATFFISLFASSFGITKFFVKGPLPILPQDAPLAGVLSVKFIILFLLNTMFVARTFCLEFSFFTSYRSGNPLQQIDPLVPEEYRLIIYLLPGIFSFLINLVKLILSIKPQDRKYLWKYPQFLLCPMLSPVMFEGNQEKGDDNRQPIRVWKLGSVLNSFFIGCLPQIILVAVDYYRRVSLWDFQSSENETNALLKFPYGNMAFAIATLLLYVCLMIIFLLWDKIVKETRYLCVNDKENYEIGYEASNKNINAAPDSIPGTLDDEICVEVKIRFDCLLAKLL